MFQHFLGNVYTFDPEPQEHLDVVDVPLFTQNKNVPLGLLVQMQDDDLTPESAARLDPIFAQRTLSLATIRRNSPIDPNDQIRLAAGIRKNGRAWHRLLNWAGYPDYDQLQFCCNLIFDYFVKKHQDGISSGGQLAYKLDRMRAARTTRRFIEDVLQRDTRADRQPDAAVRIALDFQRKWAMFNFPRLLIALERIQEEIFDKLGLPPGSYGKYVVDVESLFLAPELVGLDEYGLPIQLGVKLRSQLRLGEGMDPAISSLRALRLDNSLLTEFERYLLRHVQDGL